MLTGAASAACTDSAKYGFLQGESADLVHFRLVRSLHVVLGQKIDCRLAELGEIVPHGWCLSCSYPFFVVLLGQVLVTYLEARL